MIDISNSLCFWWTFHGFWSSFSRKRYHRAARGNRFEYVTATKALRCIGLGMGQVTYHHIRRFPSTIPAGWLVSFMENLKIHEHPIISYSYA